MLEHIIPDVNHLLRGLPSAVGALGGGGAEPLRKGDKCSIISIIAD